MPGMSSENDGSAGWSVLKAGLAVLGGVVAFGIVVSLIKPALFVGAIVGAGYLGYRLFGSSKAIEGGQELKALPKGSNADFNRRMADLEQLEKKLDAQIKGRED